MAGRYNTRSRDGIVRVETDATAQVVARSRLESGPALSGGHRADAQPPRC